MSRPSLPLIAEDISAFAKSMRAQFVGREAPPGHVELLNMLARSAGHRNFQHFRANAAARARLENLPEQANLVDHRKVERVAGHFDATAVLLRWPAKHSHQQLCLWGLWAHFPSGQCYGELEVNALLRTRHRFGDPALLRRALCDAGLVSRTPDGRSYRRIERKPPTDAVALIRHLGTRSARPGAAR